MKNILVYLKGYTRECILSPAFKLFEALLELIIPIIVAAIVDNGISQANKPYIIKMALLMVFLGAVGLTFSVIAQFFAAKASVGFIAKVRSAMFSHIQRFSYADLDKIGTSTLITRLTSDANQVQNGVNLTLRLFLRSPFIVFGACVAAFTIDFKAALIFVCTIPLLSVVVFGIMLISIPLYKKVQKSLDGVLLKTRENLSGARVIRAFCMEKEEIDDFCDKNTSLAKAQQFVGKISALMNPLTYTIINLSIVILIYTGGVRVYNGVISQGSVIALYNYMSQILVELIKLANLIISITKAVASGNRIGDIFKVSPSMEDSGKAAQPDREKPCVAFDNVSFRYHEGAENALTGITFTAFSGETVGIIGSTGSGKTTLINLIPRFYDVTDGSVRIYGEDVKNYSLPHLRSMVGVAPQRAVLFKGTVRENMQWAKKNATDEEILSALEIAQAKEFVLSKDNGLDARIEQQGGNLSGGQKQRLSLARAVLSGSDILILDDSSSALDYATDAALRKALRTLSGKTIFIVAQRTASIMHADKILVLDDGRLVDTGTHNELLKRCEVYREIHFSQYGGENNEQ
ncbi:MAG: ABC transporter ATP-binding protein [Clostridia bacterium]|nr:ABC transporter ATP-binding protein [Clostridia bacterium]